MLDYLYEVLGLKATIKPWDKSGKLPIGLYSHRDYYVLCHDNVKFIVAKIPNTDIQKGKIKNYLNQIGRICEYPVIFWFDNISTYQRKSLISGKISFIVPYSQCYIPALGVCFRERMPVAVKTLSKLSAAAQVILLYAIYNNENIGSQTEITKKTGLLPMSVSRGIKELDELGVINIDIKGRRRLISTEKKGFSLYESTEAYMDSPIASRHYIETDLIHDKIYAGESALAQKTMLNEPKNKIIAVDKSLSEMIKENEIDPEWHDGDYLEVEIWKYNPALFSKNGCVDDISLTLSLKDNNDERIEGQLRKLMESRKW